MTKDTQPKEVIHIRVSSEMKEQIERTASLMREHFAGADFSQSDVVRLCIEAHVLRLREMYR